MDSQRKYLVLILYLLHCLAERCCGFVEQAANVAVCAAVRERAEDILEWVSYHKYIGISKFYLMITDDPKVGHVKEVLRAFWEQGTVEIYHLPYVNPRTVQQLQVRLYSICLESVRCVTSLTVMSFTKPKNEWKTGNVLCCREDHDFLGFWDVFSHSIQPIATN